MRFDPSKDMPNGFELHGMVPVDEQQLEELKALQNSWKDAQTRLHDAVERVEELQVLQEETNMAFNGRVVEQKWKHFGFKPLNVIFDEEKGALFALKSVGSKIS